MLFGENPFNDAKNIITDSVSIQYLVATCGCLVLVDGVPLTEQTLKQSRRSSTAETTWTPAEFKSNPELLSISMQQLSLERSNSKPIIRLTGTCLQLINAMLDRNPVTRINMERLIRHPWLTEEA